MPFLSSISDVVGITIAILYTIAGQAHFTDRITSGMAAQIEAMTPNSHKALWFFHLSYTQIKTLFGAFDLIAAAMLWRKTPRKTGLAMAVVGFTGGLYVQWYSEEDLGQVGAFLTLEMLG